MRVEPIAGKDQSLNVPMHSTRPAENTVISDGMSKLRPSEWMEVVGEILRKKSASKQRVLLCLTGKSGAGKTTVARKLRKKGLPGFKPSEIAVIDDGVMTAPLFGFINRRVRIPGDTQDNLAPFEPYLRGKRLVIYIAIKPEKRITHCDVLIRLRCDDEERRRRLFSSRSDAAVRYENSLLSADNIRIQAEQSFDLANG